LPRLSLLEIQPVNLAGAVAFAPVEEGLAATGKLMQMRRGQAAGEGRIGEPEDIEIRRGVGIATKLRRGDESDGRGNKLPAR